MGTYQIWMFDGFDRSAESMFDEKTDEETVEINATYF